MTRLVILLAVIGAVLLIWHKISRASGDRRKNLVFWSLAGLVIGTLVVLVITGRMHWLYALGGSIAAFIPRLLQWARYLPFLARFHQQFRQQRGSSRGAGSQSSARQAGGKMTASQAYEILGLKPGASRDEIIQAHKRMMQKVHPDRGGSDFLASQINQAKDTLLA